MSEHLFKVFRLTSEEVFGSACIFLRLNWKAQADKGDHLVLEIRPEGSKRSTAANAAYWAGTLRDIAEQAWVNGRQYLPRDWHVECRTRFAPLEDRPFGPGVPMSTSDMSDKQFRQYVKDVELWAAQDLGVRFTERIEPNGPPSRH